MAAKRSRICFDGRRSPDFDLAQGHKCAADLLGQFFLREVHGPALVFQPQAKGEGCLVHGHLD